MAMKSLFINVTVLKSSSMEQNNSTVTVSGIP